MKPWWKLFPPEEEGEARIEALEAEFEAKMERFGESMEAWSDEFGDKMDRGEGSEKWEERAEELDENIADALRDIELKLDFDNEDEEEEDNSVKVNSIRLSSTLARIRSEPWKK